MRYHLWRDGEIAGSYELEDMRRMVEAGQLDRVVLVKPVTCEDSWLPVGDYLAAHPKPSPRPAPRDIQAEVDRIMGTPPVPVPVQEPDLVAVIRVFAAAAFVAGFCGFASALAGPRFEVAFIWLGSGAFVGTMLLALASLVSHAHAAVQRLERIESAVRDLRAPRDL